MISDKRIFTDVFGEIVAEVRSSYDIYNVKPYYIFGHTLAIQKELIERTIQTRYPLIILGIDNEYQEVEINSRQYEVSFNCWIVDETKQEWYTSDRFEQVFKTVLFPIQKLLIEKIQFSVYVDSFGVQGIKPVVRLFPYWGRSENPENKLADPLDAIGIKFNNLLVKNNCK